MLDTQRTKRKVRQGNLQCDRDRKDTAFAVYALDEIINVTIDNDLYEETKCSNSLCSTPNSLSKIRSLVSLKMSRKFKVSDLISLRAMNNQAKKSKITDSS